MIGKSNPASIANAKNVLFNNGRFGNPKDTFDTPNTVWTPNSFFTILIARSVSFTSFCCADAVNVRQSMMIFSLPIPYSAALLTIFLAISNRSSAFSGIPSSRVSPITTPPYFLAIGKIFSMTSSLPFTELINVFPL